MIQLINPFDAHCCRMAWASVPGWLKLQMTA